MTVTTVTYDPEEPRIPTPISTTWYYNDGSAAAEGPAPSRSPLSHDEMHVLMMQVSNFQTRLLWLYCDWVEEARQDGLPAASLAPKVQAACARVYRDLMALLTRHLEGEPPTMVDSPGPGGPPTE